MDLFFGERLRWLLMVYLPNFCQPSRPPASSCSPRTGSCNTPHMLCIVGLVSHRSERPCPALGPSGSSGRRLPDRSIARTSPLEGTTEAASAPCHWPARNACWRRGATSRSQEHPMYDRKLQPTQGSKVPWAPDDDDGQGFLGANIFHQYVQALQRTNLARA